MQRTLARGRVITLEAVYALFKWQQHLPATMCTRVSYHNPVWSREHTSQRRASPLDLVSLEALVLKTALPSGLILSVLELVSLQHGR